MTDQQLIDALVKLAGRQVGTHMDLTDMLARRPVSTIATHIEDAIARARDINDTVCALAGLLDQPTPERRAAALAALDLPQETR